MLEISNIAILLGNMHYALFLEGKLYDNRLPGGFTPGVRTDSGNSPLKYVMIFSTVSMAIL
jgi:hypothetical protein